MLALEPLALFEGEPLVLLTSPTSPLATFEAGHGPDLARSAAFATLRRTKLEHLALFR